ncbi:MAG: septum site-determining protein MinC [Lachnospiraceae bacterium]|nr:septum site-determining protein MinC [Lachnospiraceae bacterium]
MKSTVTLKSFKNGINIRLDPEVSFETIYRELIEKFSSSAKFFGKAKLVVSFEGRELSDEEEDFLIECIQDNSDITVTCVIGNDENREVQYIKAMGSFAQNSTEHGGQFYKGSVKAGESLQTDSSLIILGDVNPGATVAASGNIIVLGTLYGNIQAGCFGDDKSFITALDLKCERIMIGDHKKEISQKNSLFLKNKAVPKIVYVEKGEIEIKAITTDTLNSLDF